MASVQADEETYSLEETIPTHSEKNQICSTGECFQANDSQGGFFTRSGYLRSKPHAEGEHFL